MVQISTNDLRAGNKVEMEGQPYIVVNVEFVKPGKGQAFNKIRIKNLLNGRVVDKTFKSTEKLDIADVEEKQMKMIYREMDGVVFMDDTSYEQVTIPNEGLGDNDKWLLENQLYSILFYKGEAINIEPPTFMILKIIDTAPGVRGDTASGRVLKPAILETGAKVQVPIFVDQDETIKVDTRTCEYVSRAEA